MKLGIQHPCRFRSEQTLKWVNSNLARAERPVRDAMVDVSKLHIISFKLIRFESWLSVYHLPHRYFMDFVGVVRPYIAHSSASLVEEEHQRPHVYTNIGQYFPSNVNQAQCHLIVP